MSKGLLLSELFWHQLSAGLDPPILRLDVNKGGVT
jgi:hypothetical protein